MVRTLACKRQTFLLAKRPSEAMSEEKRLPFAGYVYSDPGTQVGAQNKDFGPVL